jgi:hypothetical protein
MNYTLTNPKVEAYFKGDDTDPPVSELIYIHSHPMLHPTFLDEVDALLVTTAKHILAKNITGYPIQSLAEIAISIGTKMPTFNEGSAPLILTELRNLYVLCNHIIDTL